ncbi:hypothetical protein B0T26DRAFT_736478 [Lasiosphaeria miniovina]|uniref:Uncharacterized protein n=1 Tax=Lasiosphaeria miniovina TaxID=1954250 RepID=A0AA40E9Q2_9PEZI|nr:uncharacterized protein B0T26DRAFT_736478 [Lasiosphaeria miniovina]KAK0733564.1 hypothetical protein B0T26DRAFT_736478 [Lasiosphaeria miniovina]
MAPSRQPREYRVESSWRVVEGGENDSFDTSILHDDEELIISSSSDPSQLTGSQPFSIGGSQPFSIGGSQDESIENFLSKAENDEQVILSTPFRPSVPQSVRYSSREARKHRDPEPEFYMPKVEVESPRRDGARQTRNSLAAPPSLPGLRRRRADSASGPAKPDRRRGASGNQQAPQSSLGDRLSKSLPDALLGVLSWIFGLVGLAFRYAQKPLAILASLYLVFGGLIVLQNMATKSITASLSPICRVPGASWLDLPFCPDAAAKDGRPRERGPVEFDDLMHVQDRLEEAIEKSVQRASIPIEMKRSEAAIRDLRTLVKYSNLQSRNELTLEFDGLIDTVRATSRALQKFNSRVGSTVDWVISMSRWTSSHLDSSTSADDSSRGLLGDWASWLFAPFQPAVFTERIVLDRYVELASLVSERIASLIEEAETVLGRLKKAEDHLELIHDLVTTSQKSVQVRRDDILWTLWTLIGVNSRPLANLNGQLALLAQVSRQRSDAVHQINELVVELGKIEASLSDLRTSVAEPGLVRGKGVEVPLSVHIETINQGVERLEAARNRIRAAEDEQVKAVLARGNGDERLIDEA